MSKIKLVCATCNKEFEKEKGEYNRKVKAGKDKFYCCLSCYGKSPETTERILSNRTDYPVWNLNNPKKQDEYSVFKPFLRDAKRRKKKEYSLTLEHLKDVWESQNGTCPFTGFALDLRTYKDQDNKLNPLNINSASLDRIDNNKGYIIGNVRFVSVMLNFARNKFSDEDVIKFAKAIVIYRG